MEVLKVGVIVNPIAGMGGAVGLKGTDGKEILQEAIRRGARPVATKRCVRALRSLEKNLPEVKVITCPGNMGEEATVEAGVLHELLPLQRKEETTGRDTQLAARLLEKQDVRVILFAGGDGTARDVAEALNARVTTLGIPCGVKNYSAVFASSPEAAGNIAASYARGEAGTIDQEVLDFDEESMRHGEIRTRVTGILRVPSVRLMQNAKAAGSTLEESEEQESIAKFMAEEMDDNFHYVLGPGSTVSRIAGYIGLTKTLLGVDVVFRKRIEARDVTAADLERLAKLKPTKLIVSPIGGQGYILGRGNQQVTPTFIRTIGKDNIIVVCSRTKLLNIRNRTLLVDTGDVELDAALRGFWKVVVGYREFALIRVNMQPE